MMMMMRRRRTVIVCEPQELSLEGRRDFSFQTIFVS